MIRDLPEIVARALTKDHNLWLAELVRYLDESRDGLGVHQTARATFTVPDGGKLVGTYDLTIELPVNAIVIRSWYDVTETFQSRTDAATIAIGIETDDAAGIVAAVAISDGTNPWDQGYHEGIQTGTAATASEKATDARTVQLTIGAEDLTFGALVLFLEYVVSEEDSEEDS